MSGMVAALRRNLELAGAYRQLRQILGGRLTVEQVVETVISLAVLRDAVLDESAPTEVREVALGLGLGPKPTGERVEGLAVEVVDEAVEPSVHLRAAVLGLAHRQALLAIREELAKVEAIREGYTALDQLAYHRKLALKIDNLVEASLADSNGVKS